MATDYLFRVELHDPSLPIAGDHNNHVVSGGHIDGLTELADLVEGTLVVTEETCALVENEDVIVAWCTFGDVLADGYFLWQGVGLLVVLFEEMVVVSCITCEVLPQTYIFRFVRLD